MIERGKGWRSAGWRLGGGCGDGSAGRMTQPRESLVDCD